MKPEDPQDQYEAIRRAYQRDAEIERRMREFTQRIQLPDAETLLQRLKKVDNANHLVEYFYPQLLKVFAGKNMMNAVLFESLSNEMGAYVRKHALQKAVLQLLLIARAEYIDALVTDEAAAEKIKKFYCL